MSPSPLVIIHIKGESSPINYARRMYAILRKYTPDAVEGNWNECFADLTGLRTFFRMTYKELINQITCDLKRELGISFSIKLTSKELFEEALFLKKQSKKQLAKKGISTYKEMNGLSLFKKVRTIRKQKFTIPFLGKVA